MNHSLDSFVDQFEKSVQIEDLLRDSIERSHDLTIKTPGPVKPQGRS